MNVDRTIENRFDLDAGAKRKRDIEKTCFIHVEVQHGKKWKYIIIADKP